MKLLPEIGLPGRILCLLVGIVVMCLSSSFYFTADLGVVLYLLAGGNVSGLGAVAGVGTVVTLNEI